MKLSDLKNRIASLSGFIGFDYNDTPCGIDPINQSHFEMWCGNDYITAKSIDEVMTTKIFNGNSLTDIFDKITNFVF